VTKQNGQLTAIISDHISHITLTSSLSDWFSDIFAQQLFVLVYSLTNIVFFLNFDVMCYTKLAICQFVITCETTCILSHHTSYIIYHIIHHILSSILQCNILLKSIIV